MSKLRHLYKIKKAAYKKCDLKEVANVCNLLGNELEEEGEFEKALSEHQEEASVSESIGETIGVAVAHRRMGEVYAKMGDWDEALRHEQTYLSLAKECGNAVEQQRAFVTLGRIHMHRSENDAKLKGDAAKTSALSDSEQAFLTALSLCDDLKNDIDIRELAQMRCGIYHNLGLVVDSKGEETNAVSFINMALEVSTKYDLNENSFRSHLELSRIHAKTKKLVSALGEAKSALECATKLQSVKYMAEANLQLGRVNLSNDDFNAARRFFRKAYKLKHPERETRDSIEYHLKTTVNICRYRDRLSSELTTDEGDEGEGEGEGEEGRLKYLDKMGDAFTNLAMFEKAILFYEKRLRLALQVGKSGSFLAPIYVSLAETYKDVSDFKKAREYYEKELDIHAKSDPKEAIGTLIEIAKLTKEERGEGEGEGEESTSYLDRALCLSEENNLPKLKGDVISLYLSMDDVPESKRSALEVDLRKLKEEFGEQLEEVITEGGSGDPDHDLGSSDLDEVDLDQVEFSDSDKEEEEETSNPACRLRASRSKSFKMKKNLKGESLLHVATIEGNVSMTEQLLNQKHPVNLRDNSGWLPIHEACNWGHTEIAKLLIEAGAWINDRGGENCSGMTPLHDAASNGHLEVIDLLVNKGASVCVKDDNGRTPLDYLIEFSQREELSEVDSVNLKKICELLLRKMEKSGFGGLGAVRTKIIEKKNVEVSSRVSTDKNQLHFVASKGDDDETDDDVTHTYRTAIKGVGSLSKKSTNPCFISSFRLSDPPRETLSSTKPSLICEDDYVVDDWLVEDLKANGECKRRKKRDSGGFDVSNNSGVPNFSPPFRKRKKKQPRINSVFDEGDLGRNEEPDPSSKNDGVSEPRRQRRSSEKKNFEKEENGVTPIATPSQPQFSLRVKVLNKNLLVPINNTNINYSFGWLENEVSRRYSQIAGVELLLNLLTLDHDILNFHDAIGSVFSASNNELVATVTGVKRLPPLQDRYSQVCREHNNLPPSPEITSALASAETSAELDLRSIYLREERDVQSVLSSIHHQNLLVLNLSFSRLHSAGLAHLIQSLSSLTVLEKLELECCSLTSKEFDSFAEYLRNNGQKYNSKLASLNVSYNDFSNSSWDSMATLISLPFLRHLNVSSCDLRFLQGNHYTPSSDDDERVSKSNLRSLDCDFNEVGLPAFSRIISHCPSLARISFRGSLRGDTAGASPHSSIGSILSSLLGAGSECALQSINLSSCGLLPNDVSLLSSYIYRCHSLKGLNLSSNPAITLEALLGLLDELAQNPHVPLASLSLHGTCSPSSKQDGQAASSLASRIADLMPVRFSRSLTNLTVNHDGGGGDGQSCRSLVNAWRSVFGDQSRHKTIKGTLHLCVASVDY